MTYRIVIHVVPEKIYGEPMYFWCLMGCYEEIEANYGHGWAKSIHDAAKEAQAYYQAGGFLSGWVSK